MKISYQWHIICSEVMQKFESMKFIKRKYLSTLEYIKKKIFIEDVV